MDKDKYEIAKQLAAQMQEIKDELSAWGEGSREGIVDPIVFTLRMGGPGGGEYILKHFPPNAAMVFKAACIAWGRTKLSELQAEFQNL